MRNFSLALSAAASIAVAAAAPLEAQLPSAVVRDAGPTRTACAALARATGRRFQMDTTSFVMAMGRGAHGHWSLGQDAFLAHGRPPARPLTGPVLLVSGLPADSLRPFADLPLAGAVVIQVVRAAQLEETIVPLAARAAAGGAKAWIVVTDLPEPVFATLARRSMEPQDESPCDTATISIYVVRDSAAADVLRAAGEDVAALLAPGAAPAMRALPGFTATVVVRRSVVADSGTP